MIEGFLTYLRSEKRYSELTVRAYGDDIRQCGLFCCGVTAPPTPEEEADILRSFDPTLSEGNDLRGGGQVQLDVGGNGVLDHVQGNVAHRVQVVQHADGARAVRVEMERYLGNVAGLVGDALNVGDHLQRRGDLAQVARHGLLAQKQR